MSYEWVETRHLEAFMQRKRSVIRLSWDAKEGILSAEGSGGKVLLIIQTVVSSLCKSVRTKTY